TVPGATRPPPESDVGRRVWSWSALIRTADKIKHHDGSNRSVQFCRRFFPSAFFFGLFLRLFLPLFLAPFSVIPTEAEGSRLDLHVRNYTETAPNANALKSPAGGASEILDRIFETIFRKFGSQTWPNIPEWISSILIRSSMTRKNSSGKPRANS